MRKETSRSSPTELLDARAQHLHHDLAAGIRGPVNLAERSRRERLRLEALEHLAHVASQLLAHHPLGHARRQRRDLVGERGDGAEIRLGQDVRPGGEHLRQLDEGGSELGERAGQPLGPAAVALGVAAPGPSEHEEAPPVPHERQDERKQPAEDDESAHLPRPHSRSHPASPSSRRKPQTSVKVVTKIEEAMAGSIR